MGKEKLNMSNSNKTKCVVCGQQPDLKILEDSTENIYCFRCLFQLKPKTVTMIVEYLLELIKGF